MQIEIRLRKLLQKQHLKRFGVESEIARYCGVNRHTIGRLYRNQGDSISLKLLSKICDWLEQEKNVPPELLPQALFGRRPARLWEAIGSLRTRLYLGVYQESHPPEPDWKYIAQGDVSVESAIIQHLTQERLVQQKLETQYVPFRFRETQEHAIVRRYLEKDIENARKVFVNIKTHWHATAQIYVGSPIVNLMSELLISDLFGSDAFQEAVPRGGKVPFYMLYRSSSHAVRSCFGGRPRPAGYRGKVENFGVLYRDKENQWQLRQWVKSEQEPGIVITVYDPGCKAIQLVVFGYTGVGTEKLGAYLVGDGAEDFWPPHAESRGKQIGVYICQAIVQEESSQEKHDSKTKRNVKVTPLSKEVLEKYLR